MNSQIHGQHSLWFPKRHKNCLSGNCFSLRCKYLVKQFPDCCFILKNGNSWRKEQPISSKKSKSGSFFSWSGNSWIPGYPGKQKTHWNVEISMGQSLILVGMTGFEPAAFASRTQRSTKLSHTSICLYIMHDVWKTTIVIIRHNRRKSIGFLIFSFLYCDIFQKLFIFYDKLPEMGK